MRKKLLGSLLLATLGVAVVAGSAAAIPLTNDLQDALDARTLGLASSVNVQTDMISDANDSAWTITATGGSVSTLLFEFAAYAPTTSFGIYDLNDTSHTLELFAGASSAVSKATLLYNSNLNLYSATSYNTLDQPVSFNQMILASPNFGYYLNVAATGNTYFSNTLENIDSFDHMLAYQGVGDSFSVYNNNTYATWTNNEYVLAWEDLLNGGDQDFTDFVVMVESVEPVPEPNTMILFGAGLIGLAGFASRKRTKK